MDMYFDAGMDGYVCLKAIVCFECLEANTVVCLYVHPHSTSKRIAAACAGAHVHGAPICACAETHVGPLSKQVPKSGNASSVGMRMRGHLEPAV